MATPTQKAVQSVLGLMKDPTEGLSLSIGSLWQGPEVRDPQLDATQTGTVHAPAELVEKAGRPRFPVYQVYVEKIRNQMSEKFKRFSGTVEVVIEVRESADRLEGLTEQVQFYADAVADVIERRRGCLEPGIYLPGTYEVVFEPVKRGGLNFMQTAKVKCVLEVNRN